VQTYHVRLESPVSKGYRCKRAADSLDIDAEKKSVHELTVQADVEAPYNVGLIVGASGSGKTTLAKRMFGDDCFRAALDESKPVIEQFPKDLDYEACAAILSGVGLTSVPCWIRPACTLSNGQKARAEAALLMTRDGLTVIDEWTSVVDRTVAKVMSHCVQKFARKQDKRVVLVSCHYDVVEWLNPCWVIDCNKGTYEDRRSLWRGFRRTEQLTFEVREVGSETWRYFSKYHYLSERLPGGKMIMYGLFLGPEQVGFVCYANYTPRVPGKPLVMHFNRLVVHPDYAGLGLGRHLVNATARLVAAIVHRVMGKFSSVPVYRALRADPGWRLVQVRRQLGRVRPGQKMLRKTGFRENIKTYSFEYAGG
jgi:energy-coupling factor transporter ATP-binding protein EcfA2